MKDIDIKNIIEKFEISLDIKLNFSEDNIAEVIFNNGTVVGIKIIEEDGIITFSSVIAGELPDPISDQLVNEILELNCVPGMNYGGNAPVIARDKETGFVFLYEVLTTSFLSTTSLVDAFLDFIKFKLALSEHFDQKNDLGSIEIISRESILA